MGRKAVLKGSMIMDNDWQQKFSKVFTVGVIGLGLFGFLSGCGESGLDSSSPNFNTSDQLKPILDSAEAALSVDEIEAALSVFVMTSSFGAKRLKYGKYDFNSLPIGPNNSFTYQCELAGQISPQKASVATDSERVGDGKVTSTGTVKTLLKFEACHGDKMPGPATGQVQTTIGVTSSSVGESAEGSFRHVLSGELSIPNIDLAFKEYSLGHMYSTALREELRDIRFSADFLGYEVALQNEYEFWRETMACSGEIVLNGVSIDCRAFTSRILMYKLGLPL